MRSMRRGPDKSGGEGEGAVGRGPMFAATQTTSN